MNRKELRAEPRRAPRSLLLATAVSATTAVALLIASDALAGPVRGELNLPDDEVTTDEEGPHPYYWNAWNGFLEPRKRTINPRRELSVVLTGPGVPEPIGCEYRIVGGDLQPRTIVAKGGASLRIENRDGCTHELQSEAIDGFAPLATAPGNARAINIPTGGPHELSDRLYGHIHGWVIGVDDLVACATIAEDGKYQFESVPAGEYTLTVYRDGEEVTSQPVAVTGDAPVTIDPITLE